jgi:hypothetical protein
MAADDEDSCPRCAADQRRQGRRRRRPRPLRLGTLEVGHASIRFDLHSSHAEPTLGFLERSPRTRQRQLALLERAGSEQLGRNRGVELRGGRPGSRLVHGEALDRVVLGRFGRETGEILARLR